MTEVELTYSAMGDHRILFVACLDKREWMQKAEEISSVGYSVCFPNLLSFLYFYFILFYHINLTSCCQICQSSVTFPVLFRSIFLTQR